MHVPFNNLFEQYQNIKDCIDNAITDVIKDSAFIGGKYKSRFEEEFAAKYDVKHCVSCANGTDAIYIVLKMLGIGVGDEVITAGLSWISTAETISQAGARPVFVDIEEDYYTIDPQKIEEKITNKTKAIIPVHLYGQPAEMEKIKKICEKNNLFLIEDCAQSHFSTYNGKYVGLFGDAATFSFYPGKNLGAYGDAGCIITNDSVLAEKMRMFANHGALTKHEHLIEGINSRLDGIQAAILLAKLPFIDEWNQARIENANYYNKCLADIPFITTPKERKNVKHTYHLYVIRAKWRDELKEFLHRNNIETAIHYPVPLPFMKAFSYLGYKESDFPILESCSKEILSLPMFPELTQIQIEYVTKVIWDFYQR